MIGNVQQGTRVLTQGGRTETVWRAESTPRGEGRWRQEKKRAAMDAECLICAQEPSEQPCKLHRGNDA